MALEMQVVLGNGLQFKDAYFQVGGINLSRRGKPVLDDDGNRMLLDPSNKNGGFKSKQVWVAKVNVLVFKSKSVRDQNLSTVEKRSELYEVDIERPVMGQIYAAMKSGDVYKDSKDA